MERPRRAEARGAQWLKTFFLQKTMIFSLSCNSTIAHTQICYLLYYFSIFWSTVSLPSKKKLQSSTKPVNINVGLLNHELKKNQGVWYLWQFQAWICQKKRGKQKFLSFTHISQWPPPKKRIRNPNQSQYFWNRGRSP